MSETPSSTDKPESPAETQAAPKEPQAGSATPPCETHCCGCQSIWDWPGQVWAFLLLRVALGVRFFTAGLEKFRGPTDRVQLDDMRGKSKDFATDMEEFVNGELAPPFEGDNGLDPALVKEKFGQAFYDKFIEGFEKPVIDLSKLKSKDLIKEVKDFIDIDVGEDKFGAVDGLDLEKVKAAFGEHFATKFTYEDGGNFYFKEDLPTTLINTPKEKLAETIGEQAHGQFVDLFKELYSNQPGIIRSGYEFKPELVQALASNSPDQVAKAVGPEAHAQVVAAFKKSILYGPDTITTTYGYSLEHYYSNQEKFLIGQQKLYENFPIMPQWSLKPFVYGLGYALVLFGITTILGIKTRLSLVGMTLTYMALAFGAGLLASAKTSDPTQFNLLITMLFLHVFMCVYALTQSKHEKLALLK